MYEEYFGIKEKPFSIAPDPRFLYMSDGHREAMAHLLYGLRNEGGFVLLTGEVGAGKTTVCRCLFEQIPEGTNIAFILNPRLTVPEMLATVCDELRIVYPAGTTSIKIYVDAINSYLLREHGLGRRTVLIIDEAQNLGVEVLEQIRLLTNLETNQRKLLQIIMLGQPELQELLARPELRQLAQRITARHHLGPLSRPDTELYIKHRLCVAGLDQQIFAAAAVEKVYTVSGGIPRLINTLCDRAMLGAYAKGQRQVDRETMSHAVVEIMGNGRRPAQPPWRLPEWGKNTLLAVGVLLLLAGAGRYLASRLPPAANSGKVAATAVEAAAPAAEAAPVVAADDGGWPRGKQAAESESQAYAALLQQWSSPPGYVGVNPCRSAAEHGLGCFSRQESFASLLRLNRPAVLTMRNDQEEPFFAVLTGVRGETATLLVGRREMAVKVAELVRHWSGQYLLLWRLPPGYVDSIRPGQGGEVVKWLGEQFAKLDGRPPLPERGGKTVFAEPLVKRVKEFQLANDLTPDGIAGARTLIQLGALTESAGPKLIVGK